MIKKILLFLAILLPVIQSEAQDSYNVRVQKYIDQYYALAIAEQMRAGVPAAVTLGQGILETEAGSSELMTMANNHFGIKCKSDWKGEYFLHDDDLPQEHFKKYACASESFKDHSDHLKRNQRYSPLFAIPTTDYAGWAKGLKRCGYATNPQYAQRLIKIIEDFKLQDYTLAALDTNHKIAPPSPVSEVKNTGIAKLDSTPKINAPLVASAAKAPIFERRMPVAEDTTKKTPAVKQEAPKPVTSSFDQIKNISDSARHKISVIEEPAAPTVLAAKPAPKADTPQKAAAITAVTTDIKYDSGKIITVNGLKAFYAYKNEMLLQYAVKYNIRYPRLLEINDLPDAPLSSNMLIYTERKLTNGTHARHTVKEGESMLLIAQAEGMQLKKLMALNKMEQGDEPAVGTIIELQNEAARKPQVRANIAPKKDPVVTRAQPSTDFIPVNHYTHADTVRAQNAAELAALTKPTPPPVKPAPTTATLVKKDSVHVVVTAPPAKVAPVVVKEVAAPVVVNVDTPKAVIDTTKAVAEKVKDSVIKPVLAMDNTQPPVAAKELLPDTSSDDLAKLKAELDKVVYADDSKLTPAPKPVDPKKADIKKPAPKAEAKADNKNSSKYYTVKKGDTLSSIAKKNKVTIRQLEKWNDIEPDDLSLGQKLRVKE